MLPQHCTIGDHFYTRHPFSESGWAKWRVTDVGTRTVIAIRVDVVKSVRTDWLGRTTSFLTEAAAEEAGHFRGPPYGVKEHVFDEDALVLCHPLPTEI